MKDLLQELYDIVERRKAEREEGSYTAYLFDAGIDKILKKLGEECSETIIAAKNLKADEGSAPAREALVNEAADLIYHLIVMLSELEVDAEEVDEILRARMQKTGNLKPVHKSDKDS